MEQVPAPTELLQEILFREIHHRFFNSLQLLSAMLGKLFILEGAADTVTRLRDHIALLGDIHRSLSQPAGNSEHLQRLLQRLPEAFDREDVEISMEWDDLVSNPIVARGLTLIVVELVTNALKHGRHTGLKISVSLRECSEGLRLVVSNDIDIDATRSAAVPLIARQLSEALGGDMKVSTTDCYEVCTTVPQILR